MTTPEPDGAAEGPLDPPGPDWLYRWRRRFAGDSRYRQLAWRVAATTLGVGVVLAGVVLLPLPGSGWAIIFLGLAVLATEYAWAHRLLRFTKEKAQGAAASAMSPTEPGPHAVGPAHHGAAGRGVGVAVRGGVRLEPRRTLRLVRGRVSR